MAERNVFFGERRDCATKPGCVKIQTHLVVRGQRMGDGRRCELVKSWPSYRPDYRSMLRSGSGCREPRCGSSLSGQEIGEMTLFSGFVMRLGGIWKLELIRAPPATYTAPVTQSWRLAFLNSALTKTAMLHRLPPRGKCSKRRIACPTGPVKSWQRCASSLRNSISYRSPHRARPRRARPKRVPRGVLRGLVSLA